LKLRNENENFFSIILLSAAIMLISSNVLISEDKPKVDRSMIREDDPELKAGREPVGLEEMH